MDFKFSDEQNQLRDTLARFIQKDYTFEKRRAILKSKDGFSREVWKGFADMGLLAIGLPEEHGGLGGNAVDTLVVMEAFGRGMVVEPYIATVVLGAGIVAQAGSDAQKADVLPAVAAGERLLALAHYEPTARYELAHVATTAKKAGSGWVLNGAKSVVLHGAAADTLIVSARTAGNAGDAAGVSLFLVPRDARGVGVHGYPTQDGQRAADLTFKDVAVGADALIGKDGQGLPVVERAIDAAIAALCAEAVGNMGALIELTLSYIKTRKQFGVPIGTFQALQHRMADMLMQAEQARSMAYLAAAKVGLADAAERRRAVAAAKVFIGKAGRFVGQEAVQLHGGIGVTDEASVSHYFKRLTMINVTFGDTDYHLGRFAATIAAPAEPAAAPAKKRATA